MKVNFDPLITLHLQATPDLLFLLMDSLVHCYQLIISHDISPHLPNLPDGKQMIRDWVKLHLQYGDEETTLTSQQTAVSAVNDILLPYTDQEQTNPETLI